MAKEFKTMREGLAALREEILAPGGPHVDRCRALLCGVMDALGEAENITIKCEAKLAENPRGELGPKETVASKLFAYYGSFLTLWHLASVFATRPESLNLCVARADQAGRAC